MADATAIQWTDSTWNVVTGCTRVSPGCSRCYIERTPPFRMQHRKFEHVGNEATTGVRLHWDRLDKVPRGPKVFTPSLGDLFHEDVPFDFIDSVFAVMAYRPDRIFQVLTKRPERLRAYWASFVERELSWSWPLPNVWLGVSIENARFTWRADVLREIPGAVRFISAEPLLGSLYPKEEHGEEALLGLRRSGERERRASRADRTALLAPSAGREAARPRRQALDLSGIDWIIAGAESGHRARPMNLDWVREIRDACHGTDLDRPGPAFFFKQDADRGRKIGTPELDGRQWTEFPRG